MVYDTKKIADEMCDILAEHNVPIRLLDNVIEDLKIAAQMRAIIKQRTEDK